jgi:threonine/homoserine/homoserine lactone efflux protein
MQISISDGIFQASLFALGSLLAEIIYVRISLVAMDWVRKQHTLFRILEWVTLAIVVALAISSFYAATHPSQKENIILSSTLNRFFIRTDYVCIKPRANSILVWLEHRVVHKKNSASQE